MAHLLETLCLPLSLSLSLFLCLQPSKGSLTCKEVISSPICKWATKPAQTHRCVYLWKVLNKSFLLGAESTTLPQISYTRRLLNRGALLHWEHKQNYPKPFKYIFTFSVSQHSELQGKSLNFFSFTFI